MDIRPRRLLEKVSIETAATTLAVALASSSADADTITPYTSASAWRAATNGEEKMALDALRINRARNDE